MLYGVNVLQDKCARVADMIPGIEQRICMQYALSLATAEKVGK